GGEALEQAVGRALDDRGDGLGEGGVVDGLGEVVRLGCAAAVDLHLEVHHEALPELALGGQDAVAPEALEAAHRDHAGAAHLAAASTAVQVASASTAPRTSSAPR